MSLTVTSCDVVHGCGFFIASLVVTSCGGGVVHRDAGGMGGLADGGAGGPGGTADSGLGGAGGAQDQCRPDCQPGACQPIALVTGLASPKGMALDADNVYFTNTNANTLMKVAKAGGPAEVIAPASTPGMGQPWGVAVAGPYVYWATFADETIQRVGLAGESPTVLVTGQGYAMEIVVDATSLYWTRQGGMVGKATRDGGPPMVWTSLGAWSIAIDETSIYWTNYNALGTGPGVGKMSLDGESPVLLATAERDDPRGIAVDTSSVYWTNHFAGTVMKVSKAGGPTTMLASDQGYPDFVAVDSTGVYWTAQRDGTVMRVGLDGGPPMIIASGQLSPGRIALDACYVYWLGGGAGTGVVTKVAK